MAGMGPIVAIQTIRLIVGIPAHSIISGVLLKIDPMYVCTEGGNMSQPIKITIFELTVREMRRTVVFGNHKASWAKQARG